MKGGLPGWDASAEAMARDVLRGPPEGRGGPDHDAVWFSCALECLERALAEIERLRTRAAAEEIKAVAAERRCERSESEIGRLRAACADVSRRLVTESMYHGGTPMQRRLLDVANVLDEAARGKGDGR